MPGKNPVSFTTTYTNRWLVNTDAVIASPAVISTRSQRLPLQVRLNSIPMLSEPNGPDNSLSRAFKTKWLREGSGRRQAIYPPLCSYLHMHPGPDSDTCK
ncbi:hypothetical protein J6590_024987 [Homalodisca vitripennis]|nr:hypothetical protein J6590_024987 [Homalodisca vitripennis]